MIGKINSVYTLNPVKIAFKSNESPISVTETIVRKEISTNSNEALAAYAKGGLNFNYLLDVKPLKLIMENPEDVESIKGEKIYTSDGNLHSIVKRDNKTKTTYEIDPDNENLVSVIRIEDKETGKLLSHQINRYDEKGKDIFLAVFNPVTGKEDYFTNYFDGKLFNAGKAVRDYRGNETYVTKHYDDNSYSISNESKKTTKHSYIHISGDKKTVSYSEYNLNKNGENEISIDYYNGAPLSVRQSQTKTVPNFLMLEVLKDEDLVAVPPLALKALEKALLKSKGEETYYSNGALETKTVVNNDITTVLKFTPDNKLQSIESDRALIKVHGDNAYSHVEKIFDGVTRETFRSDFMTTITYNDNGNIKEISYENKTKMPTFYREAVLTDGEEKEIKTYYFDKNGMVNGAHSY